MSTAQEQPGGAFEPRPIAPNVYPMLRSPAGADSEELPAEQVAAAFRGFLESLGLDLTDPDLTGTAERVARAYQEMLGGLRKAEPTLSTFPNTKRYGAMVSVTDAGQARSRHVQTRRPSLLSTGDPGSESAGRVFRQRRGRSWKGNLQCQSAVRHVPRAASLHRTGKQPARADRDRRCLLYNLTLPTT
jgi:hypothetical protein